MPDGAVDPLLGVPEIAERLGVTQATVRSWIHRGYFPDPDHVRATRARQWRRWRASRVDQWWGDWPWRPDPPPITLRALGWDDLP